MKRVILNENQINAVVMEMLNEIKAGDAYTRFYAGKIPEDQYKKIMAGTNDMTKLHKLVLDMTVAHGFNNELVSELNKLWTEGSNEAKAYALEMIPSNITVNDAKSYNGLYYSDWNLMSYLSKVRNMKKCTEGGFAERGLYVIYENELCRITCTTSYAASVKNFNDSHWCTASGIDGKFNGFHMFQRYIGEDDTGEYEPSILVQIFDKNNRENAVQTQITEDGEIGETCNYQGKRAEDEAFVSFLEGFGMTPESLVDEIIGPEKLRQLIKQTNNDFWEEYDYWEKKTEDLFKKRYDKFIRNRDTEYEKLVLEKIANEETGNYGWPYFNISGPFSKIDGVNSYMIEFCGANEEEYKWRNSLYFEESLKLDGFKDHQVWFVADAPEPKILAKFDGYVSVKFQNILMIGDGNPDIDWSEDESNSLVAGDGRVIVKNVEVSTNDRYSYLTLNKNGHELVYINEYPKKEEGIYVAVVDAFTGEYLGRPPKSQIPDSIVTFQKKILNK